MSESDNQVVIYKAPGGTVSLEVKLQGETVWLDAHQMAQLFGRDRTVIVRHIRNIYQTKELNRVSTCAKIAQVAAGGREKGNVHSGIAFLKRGGYFFTHVLHERPPSRRRLFQGKNV